MDRNEFMNQLARLLVDIPESERSEALEFYYSYFEEAGPENEQAVIKELGSPQKVAMMIKEGLKSGSGEYGEYTEKGYQDVRERQFEQVPQYREDSSKRNGKVLLIAVFLVVFSSVITGAAWNILKLILLIVFFPFLLPLGLGGIILGLGLGGIVVLVAGIGVCFVSVGAGVACMGTGLVLLALAVLLLAVEAELLGKFLPWMVRKEIGFAKKLFFGRKRGEANV